MNETQASAQSNTRARVHNMDNRNQNAIRLDELADY